MSFTIQRTSGCVCGGSGEISNVPVSVKDLRGLETLTRPARVLSLLVTFTGGFTEQRMVVITDRQVPIESVISAIANGETDVTGNAWRSGPFVMAGTEAGPEEFGMWFTVGSGAPFTKPERAVEIETDLPPVGQQVPKHWVKLRINMA